MKTVAVTGATAGIGLAVCRALLREGVRVLAVGHTQQGCDRAQQQITDELPTANIRFFYGDLAQQREVHRVADELDEELMRCAESRLDALICNAGCVRSWYCTTEEGYESQFALNHLSGFLLAYRLFPQLASAKGRLILTGSNSHKGTRIRFDDIMLSRRYSCLFAYKQSKLCNMLFALEINRRYACQGLRAYVADPGLVDTDIGQKHTSRIVSAFWSLRRRHGCPPDTAAENYSYLCREEPQPTALYYHRCLPVRYGRNAQDALSAGRLFRLSERLCGIEYPGGGEA